MGVINFENLDFILAGTQNKSQEICEVKMRLKA